MALRIAACAAAALLFFAAAAASAADEGLKRLRIAYPSNSLCCVPLFAAVKWKIFEENGLSVEIVQIRSQLGNAALAGGEVQSVAGVHQCDVERPAVARDLVRFRPAHLLAPRAAGNPRHQGSPE